MEREIKAAEPLVIGILAVVFGIAALSMGYNGVVILSVFGILGSIVGWKLKGAYDHYVQRR